MRNEIVFSSTSSPRSEVSTARWLHTDGLRTGKPEVRSLRLLFVLVVAMLAGGAAWTQSHPLTLDEAVRLAQGNNPDLQMLMADVDAAKARLAGASLLFQDNPSVTLSAGPRSSPAGGSRDESVEVMQPIEIGGQRGARIEAAEALVEAAEARHRARSSDLTAATREAFGRALAADKRLLLAAEGLSVAEEGSAAAQERFEAGATALLEVNTARVELGRMARELSEAERRLAEAEADLTLLLGVEVQNSFELRGDLVGQERVPLEEARLIGRALTSRAEIAMSQRTLDAARAQARLADRERIPTPRIGVSYSREELDTKIVRGVLNFEVPLFNRNQEARGVAAADVVHLETEVAAIRHRVRTEVSVAVARLRAARAAVDSFATEVVKAMEENMELATESYREGKIDFLQLLLIRRQAMDVRNEHIDVLEELNAARAQLDRTTGG